MLRFNSLHEAQHYSTHTLKHKVPFQVCKEHWFGYEQPGKDLISGVVKLPANKILRSRGVAHSASLEHLARALHIEPNFKSVSGTGYLHATCHSSHPCTDNAPLRDRYRSNGVSVSIVPSGSMTIVIDTEGNYFYHITSEAPQWDSEFDKLYEDLDIVGAVDMAEKEAPIPVGERGNNLFRTGYASSESSKYNYNDDLESHEQPDNDVNICPILAMEQTRSNWNKDESWKKRYAAAARLMEHVAGVLNEKIKTHNQSLPEGAVAIPPIVLGDDERRVKAFGANNTNMAKYGPFQYVPESGWHGYSEDVTGHSLDLPNLPAFLEACEKGLSFNFHEKEDLREASRCVLNHVDGQNDPGRDDSFTMIAQEHCYHKESGRFRRVVSIYTNRNGCRCALKKNDR